MNHACDILRRAGERTLRTLSARGNGESVVRAERGVPVDVTITV